NDILDFSKIEAGRMEIDTINFDLRQLVENVAEILNMRAAPKGIDLISYINPETPTLLKGDPNRLRQIIVNLVGNAIKFTDKGEVVIKGEQADISKPHEKTELHFMVSDTGIGISKADQEKLFKKFTQVDTSSTRKFGGTGLGLSISKAPVELMDGFEVAKVIKNDPDLCNIKIVMLSSAGKINYKQIQEYGIDDSIAKPVKQSILFETIMQALRIPVKKRLQLRL
ncbi:MAG: ATP-binding protein, partial [Candidatus Brocadiaceae bacterium]